MDGCFLISKGRHIVPALRAGWQLNATHEFIHPPHFHLPQPTTNMAFGGSFSKLLDKVKHPVAKGKRKLEKRESSITGEKADLASSVTQLGPRVVAEASNDREGNGTVVKGSQKSLPPDVEVDVKTVPSREEQDVDGKKVDQADLPTSTLSTSHNGKLDSMWTNSL